MITPAVNVVRFAIRYTWPLLRGGVDTEVSRWSTADHATAQRIAIYLNRHFPEIKHEAAPFLVVNGKREYVTLE